MLGLLPVLINCNPHGKQEQNFTENFLNSFFWDFASSHFFSAAEYSRSTATIYLPDLNLIHSYSWGGKKVLYHYRKIGRKEKEDKMPSQECEIFFSVRFSKSQSLINNKTKFFAPCYLLETTFIDTNSSFHILLARPKPPLLQQSG